ncbi:SDR family oxidoreductase [Pseudoduganella umbonata]|uniref:NAD(P)-dependent dehydrogenase (Short-subunit alcohol dehydrogenase family) n=1 Tax=Pseudoduganella umbonata TaxID=864828 RepID=A0A4P8HI45_9BURK|nr:SDR family oxidoreductase [Pseudoduganella umbonata]MBB3225171.1 NAD(P)-dependent dehydrogenase (short-subunit alcohol dehydrogenase family) [Pseudoduganella umbonata]QCP09299.1 SDR family oxidoreductase [Pseudoduganella umbonata]
MKVNDSIALVTGANRGMGRAWAAALLQAGACKVYAAARDPATVDLPGAIPIRLDITDAAQVAAAARECADVTLLVNNAGIARGGELLAADGDDVLRHELETNLFGTLAMCRAFAPVLGANGGGALINVLSVLSWISLPGAGPYCVAKAASWSMTNGIRHALRAQGTQVLGVHVGFMETNMTAHVPGPKAAPADVVRQALAALEAGAAEILADDLTRQVKRGLSADPGAYLLPPA